VQQSAAFFAVHCDYRRGGVLKTLDA